MAFARKLLLAGSLAAVLVSPATAMAAGKGDARQGKGKGPAPLEVQLLGLNDFHGNLEPPSGSGGRITGIDAGGAEYLATHVKALEAENKYTTVVSAGDLVGASPLLSALFRDEPTIEAMNEIGLDFNAVGNHEFDEGAAELRRLQEGGCHPTDGCLDGDGFNGANFDFLAANVVDADGNPIFKPFAIEKYKNVRVGFIGMTLEGTPDIVSASGIQGLQFLDEAETANKYARILREEHGVEAIVVLLHEGGIPVSGTGYNDCNGGISGPVVDIVNRTDQEVDLFITGHTHSAYNCVVDGRPVTSAASAGRLITDLDLTIDRKTGDITQVEANNRIVTRTVMKDPFQTDLISEYAKVAAPLANRPIGTISASILRAADAEGESALGNFIADAQLAASDGPAEGGAVAAFMNAGGVRADLTFASSAAGEGDGVVTYGESFTVQPFGNNLVTMSLTGTQILALLKQQWCGNVQGGRVLQVSSTVSYTLDKSLIAAANKTDATQCAGAPSPVSNVRINGQPLDPAASYRITVNSFLADGGDGFTVLRQGTDRVGGVVDTDALEAYFKAANGALTPPATDRITQVTP